MRLWDHVFVEIFEGTYVVKKPNSFKGQTTLKGTIGITLQGQDSSPFLNC